MSAARSAAYRAYTIASVRYWDDTIIDRKMGTRYADASLIMMRELYAAYLASR